MRHPVLAWLCPLLLSAGCLGPSHPMVPPAVEDAPLASTNPMFRIVVVTDEYLPIPGARILVLSLGLNLTVNDTGGASIGGLVSGTYDMVVSRDGFKTNHTKVEATTNQTEAFAIQLERLPRLHPHYGASWLRGVGVCSIYWVDPVVHDRECRDDPDPNYTPVVRFQLPASLADVRLNMTWEPGSVAAAKQLRFEVRILDGETPLTLLDGRSTVSVEGETGLFVRIGPELITPTMKDKNETLEVRAFPSDIPQESKVYSQRFEVAATVYWWLPPAP